jgi:hypothetical protein
MPFPGSNSIKKITFFLEMGREFEERGDVEYLCYWKGRNV